MVELRAGDVDADGTEELVAIERKRRGARPDAVAFTVLDVDNKGAVNDRWSIDVQNRALFVDIESGLWALGGEGLVALERTGARNVVETRTPLAGLGSSTAVMSDVFVDLEDDGTPEAVLAMGRTVRIVGVDGVERAKVNGSSRGELSTRSRVGTQVVTSSVSPIWRVDDFDGDGFRDLLLPEAKWLTVYHLGPEGMRTKKSVQLPVNVSPRRDDGPMKEGQVEKDVQAAWFEDLNGDGKTDFLAQLWVTEGSWLGAVGELLFAPGTGAGFGSVQRMGSDGDAVVSVELLDLDADGTQELVTAQVDFGVGTLARALVSKQVKVEMYVRKLQGARFSAATPLYSMVLPVGNDRDPALNFSEDLTGDGLPDLVTNAGDTAVHLFPGDGSGFAETPIASLEVGFRNGESKLWVGDLTGDGRAEIVVWKIRTKQAQLLTYKP